MGEFLDLPGLWIEGDDRDSASDAQLFLDLAVEAYNQAVVAQRSFDVYIQPLLRSKAEPPRQPVSRTDEIRSRIDARAYIFALDELLQFVKILGETPSIPTEAGSLCTRFADDFKHVRRIRNSLHHLEDRVRSIGPRNRPLTTKMLALFVVVDRKIGATTELNQVEYVPITDEFLETIRGRLVELIWAFQWLGPGNQKVERQNSV
jgi:hypothetical protein